MSSNLIIQKISNDDNNLFILRDDLIEYSFGGNKVRKALFFFNDLKKRKFTSVITYGSKSSNHSRVVANLAKEHNIKCSIITPENKNKESYNSRLVKMLGAEIITTNIDNVKHTIKETMKQHKEQGNKPYFIEGGGHGNLGTKAYVDVYQMILEYEKDNKVMFDYIFLASGTGTTQAGLIVGNILSYNNKIIVGVSVAREKEQGSKVICDSVNDYFTSIKSDKITSKEKIVFLDDYTVGGYGQYNKHIEDTISNQYKVNGIPLDPIYTGKAFWGMQDYLKNNNVQSKNILFIHTGGTPLFFDYINSKKVA